MWQKAQVRWDMPIIKNIDIRGRMLWVRAEKPQMVLCNSTSAQSDGAIIIHREEIDQIRGYESHLFYDAHPEGFIVIPVGDVELCGEFQETPERERWNTWLHKPHTLEEQLPLGLNQQEINRAGTIH
jgi:hypothetical protein